MRPDDCTTTRDTLSEEHRAIRNILEIVTSLEETQQARVLAYVLDYATLELNIDVINVTGS